MCNTAPSPFTALTPPRDHTVEPSGSATSPPKNCFLILPPELRLHVYELALDNDLHQDVDSLRFERLEPGAIVHTMRLFKDRLESAQILHMSLTNLAMTCKLIASEVRSCTTKLTASQRFAAIKYSGILTGYGEQLYCVHLQRAPCPIPDLTGLKLTFDLVAYYDTRPFKPSYAPGIAIRRLLEEVFLDPTSPKFTRNFMRDATKLELIDLHVHIKAGDVQHKSYLPTFVRAVDLEILKQLHRIRCAESQVGFLRVRVVECIVKED